MPFDGKVSDYFETKPAPVYDRDNPPPTMAEAIRMAVADVEEATARGYVWKWEDTFAERDGQCFVCTAGAVVQRLHQFDRKAHIYMFASKWDRVLWALSDATLPGNPYAVSDAYGRWPAGFSRKPSFETKITAFNEDPTAFKRDMLALADRLEREG